MKVINHNSNNTVLVGKPQRQDIIHLFNNNHNLNTIKMNHLMNIKLFNRAHKTTKLKIML